MRSPTGPGPLTSVRWLACAALAAAALAGCSTGPATIERAPADDHGPPASDRVGDPGAEALRTKFRFFAQDECLTETPAEVVGRCGRFTTQIRNVVPQVRQDVPAATPQADAAAHALDRLAAAGCEATPGVVGGGGPGTCGPAFAEVQRTVRELTSAVGTGP